MEKVIYINSVQPTYPREAGFEVVEVMNLPKSLAEERARLQEIRRLQREEVFKVVNGNPNFAKDKTAIKRYLDDICRIEREFREPYVICEISAGPSQTCMAQKGSYLAGQIFDQMPQNLGPFSYNPPVIFKVATEGTNY